MNFMVRPSKSFLFDVLESQLKKNRGAVGIDAASAHFKNRRMFHTETYFGIDIELPLLQKGIQKYQGDDTYGIYANLCNLERIPKNSADVVVSTNTLYHLDPQQRIFALRSLCNITAPDGYFFCEMVQDDYLKQNIEIMKTHFKNVKVRYYKNFLSALYEKIFERNGDLGSHPIAGKKAFRLFAWIISRSEYMTAFLPFLNSKAYIICKNKTGRAEKNEFSLTDIPVIDERIYKLYG